MIASTRRLMGILLLSLAFLVTAAQTAIDPGTPEKKEAKPYRIYTSGKQITIKCPRQLKHVMVWTTGGNRVVEEREINNNSCTVELPFSQKTYFIMVGLSDGKIYTEKIGIR